MAHAVRRKRQPEGLPATPRTPRTYFRSTWMYWEHHNDGTAGAGVAAGETRTRRTGADLLELPLHIPRSPAAAIGP